MLDCLLGQVTYKDQDPKEPVVNVSPYVIIHDARFHDASMIRPLIFDLDPSSHLLRGAAAAPPIENMSKFRDERTNKAILGV